ncbi:DNA-binding transcriptional regulator HcaR [Acinetobacter soli]|uniref:HTH lysR-type domain-containing protein n=1 Tax=Acinetobacter soli NIPH 2899 TaxID=1217677 RepID=A0ABP2UBQ5_9GAMM|nr:DNA-binding transcriptional regulator HcaR [Acinetobacter soli]ENV61230.1 hypothetical protein F950_00485 [Acinetobacter soli NIPH 2899]
MELRHLRYFVTVAEELNFSKAALKLYTAQPSLSQQIKDLEVDVGVQLLYRTKRKVELTEEGAVFLEQARLTLAQAEKAVMMARQVSYAKQQALRVGFVPVAEVKIFPHILPNFRFHHPDIRIDLSSLGNDEQIKALKKGELDVCFIRDRLQNDNDFTTEHVLRESLIFILPAHHPLAKFERIPLSALHQLDLVIAESSQSRVLHELILKFAKQHGIQFNLVEHADSLLANINGVAQGRGCSLVPDYVASLLPETCVTRPLEIDLPHLDLYLCYNSSSKSTLVQSFRDMLAKWERTVPDECITEH